MNEEDLINNYLDDAYDRWKDEQAELEFEHQREQARFKGEGELL